MLRTQRTWLESLTDKALKGNRMAKETYTLKSIVDDNLMKSVTVTTATGRTTTETRLYPDKVIAVLYRTVNPTFDSLNEAHKAAIKFTPHAIRIGVEQLVELGIVEMVEQPNDAPDKWVQTLIEPKVTLTYKAELGTFIHPTIRNQFPMEIVGFKDIVVEGANAKGDAAVVPEDVEDLPW